MQCNVIYIQCNANQNPYSLFCRNWQAECKISEATQRAYSNQNNSEGSWNPHTAGYKYYKVTVIKTLWY